MAPPSCAGSTCPDLQSVLLAPALVEYPEEAAAWREVLAEAGAWLAALAPPAGGHAPRVPESVARTRELVAGEWMEALEQPAAAEVVAFLRSQLSRARR